MTRRWLILLAAVAVSACRGGAPRQSEPLAVSDKVNKAGRWQLPPGKIAYRPICKEFRAPELPSPVPDEGVVPAFLFSVGGARADELAYLRSGLTQNGFAVADGTVTINGTEVLFAAGDGGVLKTQAMADRLFNQICALNSANAKLVAARYNGLNEVNRMN